MITWGGDSVSGPGAQDVGSLVQVFGFSSKPGLNCPIISTETYYKASLILQKLLDKGNLMGMLNKYLPLPQVPGIPAKDSGFFLETASVYAPIPLSPAPS